MTSGFGDLTMFWKIYWFVKWQAKKWLKEYFWSAKNTRVLPSWQQMFIFHPVWMSIKVAVNFWLHILCGIQVLAPCFTSQRLLLLYLIRESAHQKIAHCLVSHYQFNWLMRNALQTMQYKLFLIACCPLPFLSRPVCWGQTFSQFADLLIQALLLTAIWMPMSRQFGAKKPRFCYRCPWTGNFLGNLLILAAAGVWPACKWALRIFWGTEQKYVGCNLVFVLYYSLL